MKIDVDQKNFFSKKFHQKILEESSLQNFVFEFAQNWKYFCENNRFILNLFCVNPAKIQGSPNPAVEISLFQIQQKVDI